MAANSNPTRTAAGNTQKPGQEREEQTAALNASAAAFDHNLNKAAEYGNATLNPPEGVHVELPASASASTLSETNHSAKTGTGAQKDREAGATTLAASRVDAAGQRLTTNQGVPVADNQHSLKAGLRGPALLKPRNLS